MGKDSCLLSVLSLPDLDHQLLLLECMTFSSENDERNENDYLLMNWWHFSRRSSFNRILEIIQGKSGKWNAQKLSRLSVESEKLKIHLSRGRHAGRSHFEVRIAFNRTNVQKYIEVTRQTNTSYTYNTKHIWTISTCILNVYQMPNKTFCSCKKKITQTDAKWTYRWLKRHFDYTPQRYYTHKQSYSYGLKRYT